MDKTNLLVGSRYGELIVKENVESKNFRSRCLVQCDCGVEKIVDTKNLKNGNTKTCGHTHTNTAHNVIDLIGHKFGKLTVVRRSDSENNRARWVCKCDCGKFCTSTGKTLREGKKHSCGCSRGQLFVDYRLTTKDSKLITEDQVCLQQLYNKNQYQASLRGYDFSIPISEFSSLVGGSCIYCGIGPCQLKTGAKGKRFVHNGIDRVDNLKGYISGNCVTSCGVCNNMKRALNKEDFIKKCILIADNYKKLAEMTN